MAILEDENELIQYANNFLKHNLNSLKNDVKHCLYKDHPAPFPALLYCFSMIDLLSALYSGKASKKYAPGTSARTRNYLKNFMRYTEKQSYLIQEIFRHKIVHLANPKVVYKDKNGKLITWQAHHDNLGKHLKIEKLPNTKKIQIRNIKTLKIDHIFNISIWHLVEDIKQSVFKPNGYLHKLEKDQNLQDNFRDAISQIYSYEK